MINAMLGNPGSRISLFSWFVGPLATILGVGVGIAIGVHAARESQGG